MRTRGNTKKRRVRKTATELAAYKRTWAKRDNREPTRYLRRYGLTAASYVKILLAQNGVCAICAGGPGSRKRFSVDHCHDSNEVRGLLCNSCNVALGLFKDDYERLLSAAEYLHKHIGLKLKSLIG